MNEIKKTTDMFLPSGCLSESGLSGFLRNTLSPSGKALASEHLKHCEFCSLAEKGLNQEHIIDSFEATNMLLQHRIDKSLKEKVQDHSPAARPGVEQGKSRVIFAFRKLRNIAAALPILFLLGSVLWLTAALQMIDHRFSGVHELASQADSFHKVPREIEKIIQQNQALIPPGPKLAEFILAEEDLVFDEEIVIDTDEGFAFEYYQAVPEIIREDVQESETFIVVENPPQFPGGHDAIIRFLAENIQYPNSAKQQAIQGTVYLTFIVDTDGSVEEIRILRGVHWSLDEEAIRVMRAMPRWIPGKQRGRPVKVQFTMPVRFTLE